jgi:dihydroorotate dehydrogenase electron transfer subunit
LKLIQAIVISNTELMPGCCLCSLNTPYIAAEARPGQFITIRCGKDLILRRPFSIHGVDNTGQISVLFAVVGSGTEWLAKRKPGDELDVLGPIGNGFSIRRETSKLFLAAGGIGIAPLVFLAQTALKSGKKVKLLMGARSKDCLYPISLLPEGAETIVTTEDGSQGTKGKVTDVFATYSDLADQVYACGPLAMYRSIAARISERHRMKLIEVSLEVVLGCGIGACFGCSIRTRKGMKRVCVDGPVFSMDEVILEEVRI